MSSNPFRRARNPVEPHPPSANIFDHAAPPPAAPEDAAPTTPKRTKKKRVVILSPPHSPETLYTPRQHDGGHRAHVSASDSATPIPSPTPHIDPSSIEESESESTSTADDSELDRAAAAAANAGKNLGSLSRPEVAPGATRAPCNPFARTLASNEAGLGLGLQNVHAQPEQDSGATENKEQRKPAMDVDMFKNILMTGLPVPAGLSNTGGQIRQHDNSSNTTDTSSVFDPAYGLHPESPTMAYDDYQSASEDGSHSDHEQSQLMGIGRSDDIEPTVPPKPKRAVQTVSFADFDNTIPPGFQSAGPPAHIQHVTGILRTSTPPRLNSDLNKPLPKPPREISEPSPPVVPAKDAPSPQPQPAVVVPPANEETTPKKVPPPPPRRQAHGRARSVSNLSNLTQDSAASVPGSEASSIQQKTEDSTPKPAPPPPPRRHMVQPTISTPPRSSSPQQVDKKLAPVVPPARRSANTSRRTSDDLTTASRIQLPLTASGTAPPVPPSRRERGSKRRLSGEHYRGASFDSERSASISSLQQVREMGESSEQAVTSPDVSQRNILDDMAAFQAEIEALARAEGNQTR